MHASIPGIMRASVLQPPKTSSQRDMIYHTVDLSGADESFSQRTRDFV